MNKATLFTILFYLGCANELSVWGPSQPHVSKHFKPNKRWKQKTYLERR